MLSNGHKNAGVPRAHGHMVLKHLSAILQPWVLMWVWLPPRPPYSNVIEICVRADTSKYDNLLQHRQNTCHLPLEL